MDRDDGPDRLLGRPWGSTGALGVGQAAYWLHLVGNPDALEEAARGFSRTGPGNVTDRLRGRARLARACLRIIEDAGLSWDFEKGRAVFPEDGKRRLFVELVGRAWEELFPGPRRGGWDRRTTDRLRKRLRYVLPSEELTHEKLKSRLQNYRGRSDR